MGVIAAEVRIGTELPTLVKEVTLQKMQWFSGGEGRAEKVNLHTDAVAAQRDTGMKQPFASGRMSLGYASEMMSRFIGLDVFSSTGMIDFRFIKPVMPGEKVIVRGRVSEVKPVATGTHVTVDIVCENEKGEKTSVGSASAVLPAA